MINDNKEFSLLINFSNHPSKEWQPEQLDQAKREYLKIEDIPFPQIDPKASIEELGQLVKQYVEEIYAKKPTAVHIMGEMTFAFRVVTALKKKRIKCIASTSYRVSEEHNGTKLSHFKFYQFREY